MTICDCPTHLGFSIMLNDSACSPKLFMSAGSPGYQNGSSYNRNDGNDGTYSSYGQGNGQQSSYTAGQQGGQPGGQQGGQLPLSTQPQYSPLSSNEQYGHSSSSSPGLAPGSNYGGAYSQSSPSSSAFGQPGNYSGQYAQGGGAQGPPGSAGGSPNWPTAPQWNAQTGPRS